MGFRRARARGLEAFCGRARVFRLALRALLPNTDRVLGGVSVERDRGMERAAVVRNNIVAGSGLQWLRQPVQISGQLIEARRQQVWCIESGEFWLLNVVWTRSYSQSIEVRAASVKLELLAGASIPAESVAKQFSAPRLYWLKVGDVTAQS